MLNRTMQIFIRILVVFASLSLAAAMLLTASDVIGRYFFNSPIGGTYELTELMMGFFAPVAIVYGAWKREHISVDIIFAHLPKALQYLSIGLTLFIQAALSILLAWQSVHLIVELADAGTVTPVLSLPYWPAGCAIALSFAFMAFIYILELIGKKVMPETQGKEEALL